MGFPRGARCPTGVLILTRYPHGNDVLPSAQRRQLHRKSEVACFTRFACPDCRPSKGRSSADSPPHPPREHPVRQELPRRVNKLSSQPANGHQGSRDVVPHPSVWKASRVSDTTPSFRQTRRAPDNIFTNSHPSSSDVENFCALTPEQRGHKRPRAHTMASVRSPTVDAETQTQPTPGPSDVPPPLPSPDGQFSPLPTVKVRHHQSALPSHVPTAVTDHDASPRLPDPAS